MAQSGYTPILIYASGTTGNTPSAANLTSSSSGAELALNYYDGKLFYKDSTGTVQVLATKGAGTVPGSNTQVIYNNSGAFGASSNLTFNGTTLTANTLNLTNQLVVTYGGTGLTSVASGSLVYGSGSTALNTLAIGTSGYVLTSSGSAPQWTQLSSIGVTSISFGTTGLTPSTATSGAVTVAGTLNIANGGTGITSFGTGVQTALGQNVTGSGGIVLQTSPSLTTPNIGVASGTSVQVTGGFYSTSSSSFTFTDGIVVDYTSTNGRISVGSSDTLTFYNGGVANTATFQLDGAGNGKFFGTGALTIPVGTTAQEPSSAAAGMLRFNSTTAQFEGYNGTAWASVGGAAISNDTSSTSFYYPIFAHATSGTALTVYTGNANLLYKPSTGELQAQEITALNGLILNSTTISNSYTIASGYNAMSVGPVTIATGQSVTVSSGQRWIVM